MTLRAAFQLWLGLTVAGLWLPCLLYFASGEYGPFWFWMVAPFSVGLTLFVAAPLVYVLRRQLSFLLCCGFGVAIGLVGALLFLIATNPLAALGWLPAFVLSGVSSAVLFWVVGIWRNRDLTTGWSGRDR